MAWGLCQAKRSVAVWLVCLFQCSAKHSDLIRDSDWRADRFFQLPIEMLCAFDSTNQSNRTKR